MWNYKRLEVWKRAGRLAVDVYALSEPWPSAERFGLTSQVRRAAVSVGANIAEGSGRGSAGEYAQFLGYAMGSLNEVDHHLTIAKEVGYTAGTAIEPLEADIRSIAKQLHRLRVVTMRRVESPNQ